MSVRFSFKRKVATSTGTWACTAAVFSFIASSWMMRRMCSAADSMPRIWPMPLQRGQVMVLPSPSDGRGRWRDNSVERQRFAQAVFHLALVALRFHVDKVDHDQAAQVTQAQLARDLLGRLEIGAERRFLDIAAAEI